MGVELMGSEIAALVNPGQNTVAGNRTLRSQSKRIFYVPSSNPGRAYRLTLQGLCGHPDVVLVDSVADCDYVICHYQAWDAALRFPGEKLIFVDFQDDPNHVYPVRCLAYFKRSWPRPSADGLEFALERFARPAYMYPTAYAVMDEFIVSEPVERDIAVSCLLRPNQTKRAIILDVLAGLDFAGLPVKIGAVNDSGRNVFDPEYLDVLRRSRIVITAGPDAWEGDSRLWEALSNGPLVLTDRLLTPMAEPLVDGKHLVFYDTEGIGSDRKRLQPMIDALTYYLSRPDEAELIGRAGQPHALTYHRTVNRVDSMLRTVEQVADVGAQG